MCFMSGMFPLNYNMFDIWTFLAFLCDDKLGQASVSVPADVWCSMRQNKTQSDRFNPFIIQRENIDIFFSQHSWPWNACRTTMSTLVALIRLFYLYFQVFWRGRKFITTHPSTSSFLLLAVSQVRLLLIKFSADMLLVFPSGSSCYASLIAAEGPKLEGNKLWGGGGENCRDLKLLERKEDGDWQDVHPSHFHIITFNCRFCFYASPRNSAEFAALLFCSGALGIELDVRFLPLIQVASDRSVGSPNQLSVSSPGEVILPLRHHRARTLPPDTSTSHSHYSTVQTQCSAREDLPYFHHLNEKKKKIVQAIQEMLTKAEVN